MPQDKSLQDPFLGELRKGQIQVSVFLMSGIKLHGVIDAFDNDVILLKDSVTQLVYKHAISTIVPSRVININHSESDENR